MGESQRQKFIQNIACFAAKSGQELFSATVGAEDPGKKIVRRNDQQPAAGSVSSLSRTVQKSISPLSARWFKRPQTLSPSLRIGCNVKDVVF